MGFYKKMPLGGGKKGGDKGSLVLARFRAIIQRFVAVKELKKGGTDSVLDGISRLMDPEKVVLRMKLLNGNLVNALVLDLLRGKSMLLENVIKKALLSEREVRAPGAGKPFEDVESGNRVMDFGEVDGLNRVLTVHLLGGSQHGGGRNVGLAFVNREAEVMTDVGGVDNDLALGAV